MGLATHLVYFQSWLHISPSIFFGACGAPEEVAWTGLISLLRGLMSLIVSSIKIADD